MLRDVDTKTIGSARIQIASLDLVYGFEGVRYFMSCGNPTIVEGIARVAKRRELKTCHTSQEHEHAT